MKGKIRGKKGLHVIDEFFDLAPKRAAKKCEYLSRIGEFQSKN